MSFKSIHCTVAVVTAVVAVSTVASAPAHALSIGSQLNFGWTADAQTTSVNFYNIDGSAGAGTGEFLVGAGSTGDFTSLPKNFFGVLTAGVIQDLATFTLPSGGLSNFITFAGAPSKFNFKLNSFSYVSDANFSGYKFAGAFNDGSQATGSLSTPVLAPGVLQYAGTLTVNTTAVPTPALLPGLIGLSVGVLRKRKQAAERTEVEA